MPNIEAPREIAHDYAAAREHKSAQVKETGRTRPRVATNEERKLEWEMKGYIARAA